MARFALIIFLFLGLDFHGYSQTFTLNDSVFHAGDSLTRAIHFDYNGNGILPESRPFLDSLGVMIQVHDSLLIEIGTHTDYRGNDKYNQKLSEMRSKMIKNYLVYTAKIPESQLTPVGYGEYKLLIGQGKIDQMESLKEKEMALRKNRRTVFRITSTNSTIKK